MRVVCVSDTHLRHARVVVPPGDLLLVAGDTTRRGSADEIAEVDAWLGTLPHPHKLVIAGNHDFGFQVAWDGGRGRAHGLLRNATYLQDELVSVPDGRGGALTVYGSPWQPVFFDWAFNLPRGPALAEVWARVPAGIDVLLTHGPPRGILDRTRHGEHVGDDDLRAALDRIRPRLHVFGHIHESYGLVAPGRGPGLPDASFPDTVFVNASACTVRYEPVQPPIVVDL